MSALLEGAFELGKVLLETEFSKHESGSLLREQGVRVEERIVLHENAFGVAGGAVAWERRCLFCPN